MTRIGRFAFVIALLQWVAPVHGQQPQTYPVTKKVLAPPASVYAQQQVQFYGRVFDKTTQQPIPGINVQLTDVDSSAYNMRTTTNADGAYNFVLKRTRNFRIEVWAAGNAAAYEKYSSPVYNTVALMRSKQSMLPDIYLSPISKPSNNQQPTPTTNDNKNPPQQKPPYRDTTPIQKEVYLNQKLFNEYGVLPTPSAYALYYALNPGLKDLSSIPPNYALVQPQTPPFTQVLKKRFTSQFQKDSDKDLMAQQALNDSTSAYLDLYRNVFRNTIIRYDGVDADSLKKVLSLITSDAAAYQSKIGSARKAKAERLAATMTSCSEIIRGVINKKEINRTEFDELVGLGSYLSTLVESSNFLEFFRQLLNGESSTGYNRLHRKMRNDLSPQFASFQQNKIEEGESFSATKPLFNDSRAFTVSVYVQEANGHIRQSENEAEQRYLVSFYPPALRAIKRMYIDCNPLATFGQVTLHEGKYEQKVVDTFTGRELAIISSGGNSFDTRPAFGKSAKPLLGDVNFTEIKVFVKE